MRPERDPAAVVERIDQRTPVGRGVKRALDAICLIAVVPLAAWFRFVARVSPARSDTAIQGISQLVAIIPGTPGVFIRRALYRLTLRECASEFSIGFGTIVSTADICIGEGVSVGDFCNIGHSVLGADTLLGSNVTLLAGTRQHGLARLDIPMRFQSGTYRRISIGRDVWIGNGAIVADDVGDQAVVGAGALVVKPVPPRAIVVGNPARVVGERGAPEFQSDSMPHQS